MSSSSSVTFTAVAVLENGHQIGGKRTMFDAHLWLPDGKSILATLYFYNDKDLHFEAVGRYFINASVSLLYIFSIVSIS